MGRHFIYDEYPTLLHLGGEAVVHGPGIGAEQFDLELWIADQLARNFGGEFRRHGEEGGWLMS